MSPQAPESVVTAVAEAPAPKKVRKPKAPAETKKPSAKPEKKPAAKPTNKTAKNPKAKDRPDRSAADAPVQERRVAVVKMLRKVRAVDAESACPIGKLAEKLGYTKHDVYCLVFHQYPLVAEGFVSVAKGVPVPGICAYLTKKGQATDFDCEPFTK